MQTTLYPQYRLASLLTVEIVIVICGNVAGLSEVQLEKFRESRCRVSQSRDRKQLPSGTRVDRDEYIFLINAISFILKRPFKTS